MKCRAVIRKGWCNWCVNSLRGFSLSGLGWPCTYFSEANIRTVHQRQKNRPQETLVFWQTKTKVLVLQASVRMCGTFERTILRWTQAERLFQSHSCRDGTGFVQSGKTVITGLVLFDSVSLSLSLSEPFQKICSNSVALLCLYYQMTVYT